MPRRHYGHRLGHNGGDLDGYLAAARNASAARAAWAPAVRTVFADYSSDSGSWSHYLYLTAPGGTALQIVGNLTACAGDHHAVCLEGDGAGMRVFDTCWPLGGYTFEVRGARGGGSQDCETVSPARREAWGALPDQNEELPGRTEKGQRVVRQVGALRDQNEELPAWRIVRSGPLELGREIANQRSY